MELKMDDFWAENKKTVIGLGIGAISIFGLYDSFKTINSAHFGVHTRMGKVLNDTISPGVEWKVPLIDNVYQFQNNTIILQTTAGEGRNTKEQNMLSAAMRLHYKINPNEGVLALHIGTMSDDNGKELLENLMDQSFNAVVGERQSSEHMADPKALLLGFAENLDWRLHQNNVPISIEAAEMLEATIGDGANPYRTPLQLRIDRLKDGKPGWSVKKMAGPAALPVESAGQVIEPSEKQPDQDVPKIKLDTPKVQ